MTRPHPHGIIVIEREVRNMFEKVNFVEFIEALETKYKTVVALGERTHYIFTDKDRIAAGWAILFEVVEIISQNHDSIVVRIEYIDEE